MGFAVRKGSEKGASRRCLERPLEEYDPLGVRPMTGVWQRRKSKGPLTLPTLITTYAKKLGFGIYFKVTYVNNYV